MGNDQDVLGGLADDLEPGPVTPREERLREVRERAIA